MKEIRIHARAGQGAITTAAILGQAYFMKGKYPFAFPHFGAARMGAPMNAFLRVDDKPVRLRGRVRNPDFVLIVDSTLMRGFDCYSGMKDGGVALVSEKEGVEFPKPQNKVKVFRVPANDIAQEVLGRPLGNTALLGAFAAATGDLELKDVQEAIKSRFSGKIADLNIEAAKRGFEYIQKQK